MSDVQYQRHFEHFDPDLYDPTARARMAKRAGMHYAVITTKHHEPLPNAYVTLLEQVLVLPSLRPAPGTKAAL